MAFVDDRADFEPAPPVKRETEARQADGERENLRVLDTALPMVILAFAVLLIYFFAASAT